MRGYCATVANKAAVSARTQKGLRDMIMTYCQKRGQ